MGGPLERQRRRFARLAHPRRMVGARIESVHAAGLPAEWLVPKDASGERVLYYLHGGGFVACSPATHRRMVARFAAAAGLRAFLIDYRLSPEHPYPAAIEDAVAGYRFLLAQGFRAEQIVIAGDSAGGALALCALLRLRDAGEPLPAAAVCLSPSTDATLTSQSFTERAKDEAFLSQAFCRQAVRLYVGDNDPRSPDLSPLFAELHGLPPMLIHVGTHELLLDDAVQFARKAELAGVEVKLRVWEGLWHVFHGFDVPEAHEAAQEIGAFVRARLDAAPPRQRDSGVRDVTELAGKTA